MLVPTKRFGELAVEDSAVLTFEEGLYGFENCRRFFLVDRNPDVPLKWLQSADDPLLAFVVVNPFEFFPNYDAEVSWEDARKVQLEDPDQAVVLVIISVPSDPWAMTANLLAPLVINSANNLARQVVLTGTQYTTKHLLISRPSGTIAQEKQSVERMIA